MEYTPGPWKLTDDRMHVYAPETDTAITDDTNFCFPDHAEAEANARLIAAAPELLNLAIAMVEVLEAGDKWSAATRKEALKTFRKAVAKATDSEVA